MNSQKEKYIEILNSIDFEKIKDHPNILVAANFWEADRYDAAKVCYKFMRYIDDLIDNHKANRRGIAPEERENFLTEVNNWLLKVLLPGNDKSAANELLMTMEKFHIPVWPLEAFARSMIYDINNDGFKTLEAFLEYSQGASVAPASIFVHLTGLVSENGKYAAPLFDVREAAMPCAVFSYIVHIIRDFQKDQFNNLNYFADDMVLKHGLTRQELNEIARGSAVSEGFRSMISDYLSYADLYRQKTREVIDTIGPSLGERYLLSLEIIYELYTMVYERIDPKRGNFTSFELNPTPGETRRRVFETIMKFHS